MFSFPKTLHLVAMIGVASAFRITVYPHYSTIPDPTEPANPHMYGSLAQLEKKFDEYFSYEKDYQTARFYACDQARIFLLARDRHTYFVFEATTNNGVKPKGEWIALKNYLAAKAWRCSTMGTCNEKTILNMPERL